MFLLLFSIWTIFVNGYSTGISSKLDFGDSKVASSIRATASYSHPKLSPIPLKFDVVKQNKSEEFEKIGVVCVSSGCNKTNSENDNDKSIKTDVVVHVETKVNLNETNTKKIVDETPDIPIIIGYGGTGTSSDSSLTPTLLTKKPSVTIVGTEDGSGGVREYNPIIGRYPTGGSNYAPPLNTRPVYLPPRTSSRVDVKIKTLPPVVLPPPQSRSYYGGNSVEIKIPYFDPTYHNHYFGENPPPQLTWYPKGQSRNNPVAFNNVPKVNWQPSTVINKYYPNYFMNRQPPSSRSDCNCKGIYTPGVQYFSQGNDRNLDSRRPSYGDPGSQINNKLGSLN